MDTFRVRCHPPSRVFFLQLKGVEGVDWRDWDYDGLPSPSLVEIVTRPRDVQPGREEVGPT